MRTPLPQWPPTGYGAVAPLPRDAAVRAQLARAGLTPAAARMSRTYRPDLFRRPAVALVVGGTSGIGAAVGAALAGLGAVVTVTR